MTLRIPPGFLEYIAKKQVEFNAAWQLFQYITIPITFETFAMIFCDKAGIHGMYAMLVYVAIPVVFGLVMLRIGMKMIDSDYQHYFNKAAADINKDWRNMIEQNKKLADDIAFIRSKFE